jgi:hypothetical protein
MARLAGSAAGASSSSESAALGCEFGGEFGVGEVEGPAFLFVEVFQDLVEGWAAESGERGADAGAEGAGQLRGVERLTKGGGAEPVGYGFNGLEVGGGKFAEEPGLAEDFGGEGEGIPEAEGAETGVGADHIVGGEEEELAFGGGLVERGKRDGQKRAVVVFFQHEEVDGGASEGGGGLRGQEADVAGLRVGIAGGSGFQRGGVGGVPGSFVEREGFLHAAPDGAVAQPGGEAFLRGVGGGGHGKIGVVVAGVGVRERAPGAGAAGTPKGFSVAIQS